MATSGTHVGAGVDPGATLVVPDPDVAAATTFGESAPDQDRTSSSRRLSSHSTGSSTFSSSNSNSVSPVLTPSGNDRPSLSRASSLAYSEDNDGATTPGGSGSSSNFGAFRTNMSSASASMDGIDLLGASSASSSSALPLGDLLETYFHPRLDLAGRKWTAFSGGVRSRARKRKQEFVLKAKSKTELAQMEAELVKMRQKVSQRLERVQQRWQDAKVVRLRDKISFVVGVLNLVISSLCFALRPQWVPTLYSILALYFLPLRIWSYTTKKWHYFLFDFCYFLNTANLVFLWVFPNNGFLFTVCYCAAHGPLAFSVATWRNSLVFHSLEKMTSLFIHLYPPFVFTTIVHFMPRDQAETLYPALKNLKTLNGYTSFWFNVTIYLLWQLVYYELIVIRKKTKIETGERINSYSTMSRGKGPVANLLGKAPPARREPAFMLLQFIYTIVTTLPAPMILYPSSLASSIFFSVIFTISVWNGASYYVEVFGRRFEKELLALRNEVEDMKKTEKAVNSVLNSNSNSNSTSGQDKNQDDEDVTNTAADSNTATHTDEKADPVPPSEMPITAPITPAAIEAEAELELEDKKSR